MKLGIQRVKTATLGEAIRTSAWLFLGDPREIYRDINGLFLFLNGCICIETTNKADRQYGKQAADELLRRGGQLLIFPEGEWNVTDNLPCMKLYPGTADLALHNRADIVPIAVEQYGNTFYINIGKNMQAEEIAGLTRDALSDALRQRLATLKWEIWETQGVHRRTELQGLTSEAFQQEILDKSPYGFTIQDIERARFHDKHVTEYAEAFAPIERLRQQSNRP